MIGCGFKLTHIASYIFNTVSSFELNRNLRCTAFLGAWSRALCSYGSLAVHLSTAVEADTIKAGVSGLHALCAGCRLNFAHIRGCEYMAKAEHTPIWDHCLTSAKAEACVICFPAESVLAVSRLH